MLHKQGWVAVLEPSSAGILGLQPMFNVREFERVDGLVIENWAQTQT